MIQDSIQRVIDYNGGKDEIIRMMNKGVSSLDYPWNHDEWDEMKDEIIREFPWDSPESSPYYNGDEIESYFIFYHHYLMGSIWLEENG